MRQWHVFLSIILSAWPPPIDTTSSLSSTSVTSPVTEFSSISTLLTTGASVSSSASTHSTISTSPMSKSTPTSTGPLSSTSAITSVPESSSSSASTTPSTPSNIPTSSISESTTTFTTILTSPISESTTTSISSTSILTSDSTSTSTDTTSSGTSSSTSATTSFSGPSTTSSASTTLSTPSKTSTIPPTTTATPKTTTSPLTTPSTTPAPTPTLTMNDDTTSVEWNPKSNQSVIIKAEEGYKIVVTILDCNIDGTKGERATIESGVQGEGLLFTYKVKSKPSFLYNHNVLYAYYGGKGASTFFANFSRVGERLTTTTTEITSSTQFVPTPSAWNSSTITVFLSGKDPYEYQKEQVINEFKDALRKMATEYCSDQNFHLAENITINNVVIIRVDRCPAKWPEFTTCVKIVFGIPIVLEENVASVWKGYQLNEYHLKIMWDKYHKKYIDDDFVVPNAFKWVKWEIVIFCGITIAIALLLLVLKHIYIKYSRESKEDDTEEIIPSSNDEYGVSLTPHPLQEYPPIFEMTYQDISLDHPSFLRKCSTSPFRRSCSFVGQCKDERNDLLSEDDEKLSKIDLVAENLGESGA